MPYILLIKKVKACVPESYHKLLQSITVHDRSEKDLSYRIGSLLPYAIVHETKVLFHAGMKGNYINLRKLTGYTKYDKAYYWSRKRGFTAIK